MDNCLELYFDGGLTTVKGSRRLYVGYHAVSDNIKKTFGTVLEEHDDIPVTPIAAEYGALLAGLEFLIAEGYKGKLNIYGDSDAVVKQIKGVIKCGKPYISALCNRALLYLEKFEDYAIEWIPREQNKEADASGRAAAYALASASVAESMVDAISEKAPKKKPASLPLTITEENFLQTAAEKRLIKNYRSMTPARQRAIEALVQAIK